MTSRTLAVIAIFTTGCALGDLPDIPPEVSESEDPVRETFPAYEPAYEPSAVPPTAIEFTVAGVDWSLFDGPVDEPVVQTVELRDGVGSVDVELGPGAFAVTGFDGDEKVFDGTSRDQLDAATGEQTDGPFFNPTRGQFQFRVEVSDSGWSVVAERISTGDSAPFDSLSSPTTAGAWFDEAFANDDVRDAVYAHGGPFRTERGVLFIAPSSESGPAPFVQGSWSDFALNASTQLRNIAPGVAARFVEVGGEEHTYAFFDPSDQSTQGDATNRFVTPTVLGFFSVLAPTGPRTVWIKDAFDQPSDSDVYVHLPASYGAEGTRHYPTMYVHDGASSIVDGRFDEVANDIGAITASLETITVFVAPRSTSLVQTMSTSMEPADAYVDFVAGTLVPFVESNFRARSDRRARGTSGAGFGGVASYWTAVRHADTFGFTAGISAPLIDAEQVVISELTRRGCQEVVYRVAASAQEPGAMAINMRDALDGMDCDYQYVTDTRGDDWPTFGDRFGDTLVDFANVHAF